MDTQELQRLKNKFDIIGNDAALNRALEMAVAVAPTDLTVLVSGESGVGKENIPKIIHTHSLRKTGKYFAVNCGAIPEGTIDSELFGHEKGSFTGATEARKGYFEEANGGTLFLDEVGELPLASQAKLLRVLQSGEYIRVGSSKVSKTDVRVIAATNVDLFHAVGQGKFRADLYYRLNAIQISMPALRERKDDIYLLFRKFSSDFTERFAGRRINLTHDAIELLRRYRWPGNIRQLKNVAETVTALEADRVNPLTGKNEVNAQVLSQYIPKDEGNTLPVLAGNSAGGGSSLSDDEKQEIFKAIYTLSSELNALKKVVYSQSQPAEPVKMVADNAWQEPADDVDIQDPTSKEDTDFEQEPTWKDAQFNSGNINGSADSSYSIKKVSDDLIRRALEKHEGNRKKAAAELGISERTLYRKLPPEWKK